MKCQAWGRAGPQEGDILGTSEPQLRALLSLLKSRPGTAPPSLLLMGGVMSTLPWGASHLHPREDDEDLMHSQTSLDHEIPSRLQAGVINLLMPLTVLMAV